MMMTMMMIYLCVLQHVFLPLDKTTFPLDKTTSHLTRLWPQRAGSGREQRAEESGEQQRAESSR
jgi:hypothetical protein